MDRAQAQDRLLVVLDALTISRSGGDLDGLLVEALHAGARLFWYRNHAAPWRFVSQVRDLLRIVRDFDDPGRQPVRLLLGERADVALALGADGVHLSSNGLSASEVRQLTKRNLGSGSAGADEPLRVGRSCHGHEDLQPGLDYVTASPVFAPTSKSTQRSPLGLDGLRGFCRAAKVPVFALGGVTPENAAFCLRAGAFGVAVLGGIVLAESPRDATIAYLTSLEASEPVGER